METAGSNIVEVTDATFGTLVLEESRRRPVVVDFWAGWCQPCRLIGPVLERLADEHGGEFLLAKLDVDANPQAAAAFRVQSIPAVKAIVDGQVVNEFVGAVPEAAIRQFLGAIMPSDADRLAAQGAEVERRGRLDEAERVYRSALEAEPNHPMATLGLGRIAAGRGDVDEARRLLEPLRPDPDAERILSAIEVSGWAEGSGDGQGPLAEPGRAAADGRFEDALEGFLRVVRSDPGRRDEARAAMLKLFAVLGNDDPLTRQYRRRLSAALF